MKYLLTGLLTIIYSTVSAQIIIDGRAAVYDKLTGTLLATVAKEDFETDNHVYSISMEEGWQSAAINSTTIVESGYYTFFDFSADTKYSVVMTSEDNQVIVADLQFTFLPLLKLSGTFGNDYSDGTFQLISILHPDLAQLPAHIKWRGGTTNMPGKHKHNFKVKFDDDHSFLGLRNDNNWILDAGQADVFRLRNYVAMGLWNDMARKPYYAAAEPKARNSISGSVVELFLNDEYQGIYNLSENIDRKQMKVKKVSSSGAVRGCLYKVKQYGYGNMKDTVDIYDNHSETWEYIEVKYPDLNDCDTTDWSTLYNALNFITFSSDEEFASEVADYFDIPVVTDISIFIGTVNALDNRGKNIFWAVYDKTQDKKLTPVPWDLDCTVGQEWVEPEEHQHPEVLFDWQIGLTNRLTANNVLHFNDSLNHRYRQLRQGLLATDSLIDRYTSCYNMLKQSGAAQREEQRWSGDSDVRGETIDFDEEIAYISQWITTHMEWMDNAWFPLDVWYEWYEAQGVTSPTYHDNAVHQTGTYLLSGQRIDDSRPLRPGLYIRNGRKVIIRK